LATEKTAQSCLSFAQQNAEARPVEPDFRCAGTIRKSLEASSAGQTRSWKQIMSRRKRKHTHNGMLSLVDFEARQLKLEKAGD